jgi:large subunit ribosomal protein L9
MLIPKGLAVEATPQNIADLEKKRAIEAKKLADERAAAQKQAEELKGKIVIAKAKAGKEGKLFGSVTTANVAILLKEQFGLNVDKKKITLEENVKAFGTYNAEIRLYEGISAKIKVQVVEE